jgi:putative hydrolase of the HAD superfamily
MCKITAVIFDLDDTLYPERAYAFSGFDTVAGAFSGELGDPLSSAETMRRLFDTEHRPRVFDALLEKRDILPDRSLIKRMIETYRAHVPTIALHDDAAAALAQLQDRYDLGLITDGPSASQWAKIDALNLRSRFREIIVTGDWGMEFGKPHPRAFETMADRLNTSPSACVYVADNPTKDFIAPNALGWMTIQIRRPDGIYRDRDAPDQGMARLQISSLNDLEGYLA